MILITDGEDSTNVRVEHILAWENDIEVYALGVTNAVNYEELVNATGDPSKVLSVSNYEGLASALRNVCQTINPPEPVPVSTTCGCDKVSQMKQNNYWLDMIFVIDTSDGVSSQDFVWAKVIADLETRSSAEMIGIIKNKFVCQGGQEVDVQKGLELAHDMILREEKARRRLNVKKVVVLLSTRSTDCHLNKAKLLKSKIADNETRVICQLVSVMESEMTTIIAGGVRLVGTEEYPYIDITTKCNTLENNRDMSKQMMRALCRANCYCPDDYTQLTKNSDNCVKYAECYHVNSFSLPQQMAKSTCEELGGTLPNIVSSEKEEFINELHKTAGFFPFWTDATCLTAENCSYTGWFTGSCDDFMTDRFFTCQVPACSVERYCEESLRRNKVAS
ncbi:unnamed protein product [Enterobius vermicularis]|uniref:VWFA domain-containing protein n=1 Tax=Enterobius vermicularis TaxID=51028 RepID=A0A0N4VN93_ENTVE|nr:unnamed protein product [Enterobius vermicularis]